MIITIPSVRPRRLVTVAAAALVPAALLGTLAPSVAQADTPASTGSSTSTVENASAAAAQAARTAAMFTSANAYMPKAPKTTGTWKADFVDNFDSLNTSVWGRYMGGAPHGSHAVYTLDNATVTSSPLTTGGGILNMQTRFENGRWTSAGMSSGRGFSATGGKWVVKAKFDRAYGVGYAFLLYPKGGAWPPEVDFAEGTAGGPSIMATVHYGSAKENFQIQRWLKSVDMTKWHTYGVVLGDNTIDYTIDGRTWATVTTTNVPKVPMWLGVQSGVKDCAITTGECLSGATPSSSAISIDWIAHYTNN